MRGLRGMSCERFEGGGGGGVLGNVERDVLGKF